MNVSFLFPRSPLVGNIFNLIFTYICWKITRKGWLPKITDTLFLKIKNRLDCIGETAPIGYNKFLSNCRGSVDTRIYEKHNILRTLHFLHITKLRVLTYVTYAVYAILLLQNNNNNFDMQLYQEVIRSTTDWL